MTRIPTAWEMEPIGVNGALEAVGAYGFCSEQCRRLFVDGRPTQTWSEAEEPDSFEEGHVCDQCGGPLSV